MKKEEFGNYVFIFGMLSVLFLAACEVSGQAIGSKGGMTYLKFSAQSGQKFYYACTASSIESTEKKCIKNGISAYEKAFGKCTSGETGILKMDCTNTTQFDKRTNKNINKTNCNVFLGCSTSFVTKEGVCKDSDNSDKDLQKSLLTKTTTIGFDSHGGYYTPSEFPVATEITTATDKCSTYDSSIFEYSCVNETHYEMQAYNCPAGTSCNGGACVANTTAPACSDTDNTYTPYSMALNAVGDNTAVFNADSLLINGSARGLNNSVMTTVLDMCVNSTHLLEQGCFDAQHIFPEGVVMNCPANSVCTKGACVINESLSIKSSISGISFDGYKGMQIKMTANVNGPVDKVQMGLICKTPWSSATKKIDLGNLTAAPYFVAFDPNMYQYSCVNFIPYANDYEYKLTCNMTKSQSCDGTVIQNVSGLQCGEYDMNVNLASNFKNCADEGKACGLLSKPMYPWFGLKQEANCTDLPLAKVIDLQVFPSGDGNVSVYPVTSTVGPVKIKVACPANNYNYNMGYVGTIKAGEIFIYNQKPCIADDQLGIAANDFTKGGVCNNSTVFCDMNNVTSGMKNQCTGALKVYSSKDCSNSVDFLGQKQVCGITLNQWNGLGYAMCQTSACPTIGQTKTKCNGDFDPSAENSYKIMSNIATCQYNYLTKNNQWNDTGVNVSGCPSGTSCVINKFNASKYDSVSGVCQ